MLHPQKPLPPAKVPNQWLRRLPHDAKKPKPGPTHNPVPRASPYEGLSPNGHSEKECLPTDNPTAKTIRCPSEPTVPYRNTGANLGWLVWRDRDANTGRPPLQPMCPRDRK